MDVEISFSGISSDFTLPSSAFELEICFDNIHIEANSQTVSFYELLNNTDLRASFQRRFFYVLNKLNTTNLSIPDFNLNTTHDNGRYCAQLCSPDECGFITPEPFDNDNDGFTQSEGDCDDNNAAIHPDAIDIPNNGVDENCDSTDNIQNIPPTAHSGNNQTGAIGDTIFLNGAGSSDPDGDSLNFLWILNPPVGSHAVLSNPDIVNPSFDIDVPGTYIGTLIVNDGDVNSTPSQVVVDTLNSAPVANAGQDQAALINDSIVLDGSNSTDFDGDILTYSWILNPPGGSSATLDNPETVNPSFILDIPGTYRADLTVDDGSAKSEIDSVNISTNNTAPVANAGIDKSIQLGETITLDGSNSSDVDGDLLTYQWSITSFPESSAVEIINPTSVAPQFVADLAGIYTVQLIVSDGVTQGEPDLVTMSTENSTPIAQAGADQTVLVGDTVILNGTDSNDPDNDSLTFSWNITSTPTNSTATLFDSRIEEPSFDVDLPGTYIIQLTVNDGIAESVIDTVTITTENSKPIANAGKDQTVSINDTVTLDGSNSNDADGDPLIFNWSIISQPTGSLVTLNGANLETTTFIVDVAGTYITQLIVNDEQLNSNPDAVAITVQPTILDTDGDGFSNITDPDDDNDGVLDTEDAFPLDPNESLDTDNDGTGNNSDTDDDGDGYSDQMEIEAGTDPLDVTSTPTDTDGDGTLDVSDTDDDNDGVLDTADAFPLDPNESLDTDNDGTGNNADTDDDGDGYSDQIEIEAGTDPLDINSSPNDSVNDTTSPIITIIGDNPASQIVRDNVADLRAYAIDDVDGQVPVSSSSTVITWQTGSYTITYTAKDNAGNVATVKRTVNVVEDDLAPTIYLGGDNPTWIKIDEAFHDKGATAFSHRLSSTGQVNLNVTTTGEVNTNKIGQYSINYSATDADGKTRDKKRYIVVYNPRTQLFIKSKIPKTGATKAFHEFDDGYYRSGTEWNYSRDNATEIVTDHVNELLWQDNSDAKELRLNWSDAKTHCNNSTLGGITTWRMPTLLEIRYLLDLGLIENMNTNVRETYDVTHIEKTFKNINKIIYREDSQVTGAFKTPHYWTDDFQNFSSGAKIISLNFRTGAFDTNTSTDENNFRCVSGEEEKFKPILIPAKEVTIDVKNNLMWQDTVDIETRQVNWGDAINYCENLTLGESKEWRLPNANEAHTLYLETGFKFRPNSSALDELNMWTSSTYPNWSDSAWTFASSDYLWWHGRQLKVRELHSVRCVRDYISPVAKTGGDKTIQAGESITLTVQIAMYLTEVTLLNTNGLIKPLMRY